MAARRRRRSKLVLGLVLLLACALLLVVLVVLPGSLPLPASPQVEDASEPSSASPPGSREVAGGRAGSAANEVDLLAGREARLRWLVEAGRLAEALELCAGWLQAGGQGAGSQASPSEAARAQARTLRARVYDAARRRLAVELAAGKLGAAEELFALLENGGQRDLLGEFAALRAGLGRPDRARALRAVDELAAALPSPLGTPVGARILYRIEGDEALVKQLGPGGGWVFRRRALHRIDPLELRKVLLRSFAPARARELGVELAQVYLVADKPLAALMLAQGDLRPPDPGPSGRGR